MNNSMATVEEFTIVSQLVDELEKEGARLALEHRIRGEWFVVHPGHVQVRRWKDKWTIIWREDGKEMPLVEASLLVKVNFLRVAEQFFVEYHKLASEFAGAVPSSIKKGKKALKRVQSLE